MGIGSARRRARAGCPLRHPTDRSRRRRHRRRERRLNTHAERRTAMKVVDGADLTDKVCVITGATSGLGRESARALASVGAHVILAGRSRQGLWDTEEWIRGVVDDARVTSTTVDLTSLSGVRDAAGVIAETV